MSRDKRLDEIALTDDQIRAVIDRAAQMSADHDTISFKELRSIAEELDIDLAALDLALTEVLSRDVVANTPIEVEPAQGKWTLGPRALLSGAVGWAVGLVHGQLGWVATTVIGGSTVNLGSSGRVDAMVTLALTVASLAALVSNRKDAQMNRYFGEVAALWGGFYAAWLLLRGPSMPISFVTASGLAISMAAGAILLRSRTAAHAPGMPSAGAPGSPGDRESDVGDFQRRRGADDESMLFSVTRLFRNRVLMPVTSDVYKTLVRCSVVLMVFSILCVSRASAQGRDTPHLATPADSVPLTVAGAERMGALWVKPSAPVAELPSDAGTANRTCTEASANSMRSGEFVSMGWASYEENWRTGYGKIMWRPTAAGHPKTDTLTVRAVRLDAGPTTPVVWHFPPVPANEAPWFRYPSRLAVSSPGKWMFIATSGENWSCMLFTLH